MDSAYVPMALVAIVSFLLALIGASRWISVGLLSLTPFAWIAFELFQRKAAGIGETLLYMSPYMGGLVLIYALIAVVGTELGRAIARRYGKTD